MTRRGLREDEAPADLFARLATVTRELRARERLTQAEVARRAGLGKHYPGMVERARANPTITQLDRLARALGLGGVDELIRAAWSKPPRGR
jgi:transcriptional regulator with XRE-family HTH domain